MDGMEMVGDKAPDPTLEDPTTPNGVPEQPGSILDDLRTLRETKAQQAAPMFDLDVPGYEKRLLVRYRYPEGGYERAVRAAETEFRSTDKDRTLHGNADLLVACCAAVLGRQDGVIIDPRTMKPVGVGELPEQPLKFDDDLALSLGIKVPESITKRARFIVREVFSLRTLGAGAEGDIALIGAGNRVYAWLAGVRSDFDEALEGE